MSAGYEVAAAGMVMLEAADLITDMAAKIAEELCEMEREQFPAHSFAENANGLPTPAKTEPDPHPRTVVPSGAKPHPNCPLTGQLLHSSQSSFSLQL
jgi:hypothetical protein